MRALRPETAPPFTPAPALVMFVHGTSLRWLRLLAPGFRHCFVAVQGEHHWIICDPMSHRTDMFTVPWITARALAEWYRDHGMIVVETETRRPPLTLAPIRPYTCVEAVKRVLGLHEPWVLTPRQLFRCLMRQTAASGVPTEPL